jgi:NAD(P)-dependent dehydrogenase (short-subunit alcohol dehydrogenase family)
MGVGAVVRSRSTLTAMHLESRRILVTGASSGIGRGLLPRFAAEGARLVGTGRSEAALAEAFDGIDDGSFVAADLTTAAGHRAVATAVDQRFGALDVAIHAAGLLGPPSTPLALYPEDDWRAVIEVNVTAVHLLHQQLAPLLAGSDAPVVIGISSTVGREGRAGWGAYSVSKFALEGWLSTLADEWANGRVYSVNPGGTRTPMRAAAAPDEDPMTLPTPADIAPLFLRLAHRDAPEPSGAVLNARDWIGTDPWEGIRSA